MKLPVRTTIVNCTNGDKILISPGTKLNSEHFKNLMDVKSIIAPNLFHGGGVKNAKIFLPNSKTWGPQGIKEKCKDTLWDYILGQEDWPYQNDLEWIQLEGQPKINECAFFHKESKSLIIADLCFNLINNNDLGSWIILNLFGTYKKLGISKMFLGLTSNKELFKNSIHKLLNLPFENIIVSHGENCIGRGKELLTAALKERGLI